jgi:hypothetical protein
VGIVDGTGTQASFHAPSEIVLSTSGVLYISEVTTYAIRAVDVKYGALSVLWVLHHFCWMLMGFT